MLVILPPLTVMSMLARLGSVGVPFSTKSMKAWAEVPVGATRPRGAPEEQASESSCVYRFSPSKPRLRSWTIWNVAMTVLTRSGKSLSFTT